MEEGVLPPQQEEGGGERGATRIHLKGNRGSRRPGKGVGRPRGAGGGGGGGRGGGREAQEGASGEAEGCGPLLVQAHPPYPEEVVPKPAASGQHSGVEGRGDLRGEGEHKLPEGGDDEGGEVGHQRG